MNGTDYRKAFDKLSFSEDFEARTIELLRQKAQPAARKERQTVKRKVLWRAAIAVCLAAVLSVGGLATAGLLSAREASKFLDNEAMQKAFQGENAIEIDETQVMGDYTVTLLGVASGKALGEYGAENNDHKYIMMAFQANGDTNIMNFNPDYRVTPLVSGYSVPMDYIFWRAGPGVFIDNVLYMCYDISELELFADRTVTLAVYKQRFPVYVDGAWCYAPEDVFTTEEDGSIAFREDFPEEHVMFSLPLDESKADPTAAERLIDESEYCRIFDVRDPNWRSEERYDKNYYERQQKALEEAGLK